LKWWTNKRFYEKTVWGGGGMPMPNKDIPQKRRIVLPSFVIFFILGCLMLFFFLTVARDWDYRLCIPKAARKIGVEPKLSEIYGWIYAHETPGLSREATQSVLENIGTTSIVNSRFLADGTTEDTLRINMCSHPMNNVILSANYSSNNELIGITIDSN
jgi:hypothetical protein